MPRTTTSARFQAIERQGSLLLASLLEQGARQGKRKAPPGLLLPESFPLPATLAYTTAGEAA